LYNNVGKKEAGIYKDVRKKMGFFKETALSCDRLKKQKRRNS